MISYKILWRKLNISFRTPPPPAPQPTTKKTKNKKIRGKRNILGQKQKKNRALFEKDVTGTWIITPIPIPRKNVEKIDDQNPRKLQSVNVDVVNRRSYPRDENDVITAFLTAEEQSSAAAFE